MRERRRKVQYLACGGQVNKKLEYTDKETEERAGLPSKPRKKMYFLSNLVLKKLNEKNYKGLEELNEFNEWYLNRMSEEEEKKAQERDQALRNAGLILESIKKSNARKGNIEMESLNNQRPEDKAIIGR